MANTSSARKAARVIARRTAVNTARRSRMRTSVRKVEEAIAEAIEPLIAADIDANHRRTLAHALVGLAEGASRQLVAYGLAFDPELISRQVADLAWAGLRGVRRVSPSPT